MKYPGRVIRFGEADPAVMKALRKRLNQMLGAAGDPALRLAPAEAAFDAATRRAVRLFQARHVDALGRPLKQDGEVGSLTWAALFGAAAVVAVERAAAPLLAAAVGVAAAEEARGVREVPRNSNRGPEVDEYLRRAGVPTGHAWCCAFTYWCFDEAARSLGRANPTVRTGGCLDHWNRAPSLGARRVPAADAVQDPRRVAVGALFIIDHGKGLGHTGIVERVDGGLITTIEGNTDASRTREGGGVYRLTRKLVEINRGFIDYGGL